MLKKLLASQLRINMATGVVTHCLNIAVLAVSYPVYLHFLGYEKYGLWLALGVVLAITRLSDFGMAQAVTKLVAEELGKGDTQTVQQYVATAILVLSTAGGVALAIILVFRSQIVSAFKFTGTNAEIAMWLLPYIGFLSIYSVVVQALAGTLGGLGRMELSNYAETCRRIALVLFAVPLLYFGQGLKSLLFATAFSYFVKHLLSVFLIRRIVPFRLMRLGNISGHCFKRLLNTGMGLFGGSIVRLVGIPFNKFMLVRYTGVDSLPVFDIAWRGASQIRQIFGVPLRALMPEVSRITSEMSVKSMKRIRSLLRRTLGLILLTGTPLFLTLFLLSTPLLETWLGEKFIDTIPPAFRVMLLATFITLLAAPAYHFLVGLGRVSTAFVSACITWIGCVVLVFFYNLHFQRLSPFIVCACLCVSGLFSSLYLMWRLHCLLHSLTETVSSPETLRGKVIVEPEDNIYTSF